MPYYATFDSSGLPTGFYPTDVFEPNADGSLNSKIPSSAVLLSDAQYQQFMADPTGSAWVNGQMVAYTPPAHVVNDTDVDNERDRRMLGGFVFDGEVYQTDDRSIANITGAVSLAFMAIVAGAKAGDLRWNGGDTDFAWIAMDNTQTPMDAPTLVNFGKAAAAFRSSMIFAARALKNQLAAGNTIDLYADASWGVDSTSPTSTAHSS